MEVLTFNLQFQLDVEVVCCLKIQNSSKMAQIEVEVELGGLDEPQRGRIGLALASPLFFLL